MWEEVWAFRDQLQDRLNQLSDLYGESFLFEFSANPQAGNGKVLLKITLPKASIISRALPIEIKGELQQIKGWLIPTLDYLLRE